MIVIDTNYLIEFFLASDDIVSIRRRAQARKLLSSIQNGEVKGILPEVVVHECFYVLVMRMKVTSPSVFSSTFQAILAYSGWAMGLSEIEIMRRALDILEQYPKLEFSDAVIASRAEAHDAELATFDRRLAKTYGGPIWSVD